MSVAVAYPTHQSGFLPHQQPHQLRPSRRPRHHKRRASPPRPSQAFCANNLLVPIPEEVSLAFTAQPLTPAPHWDDETTRLIQQARHYAGLPALERCASLDEHARAQALQMAQEERCFHSVQSVAELKRALQSEQVGENIHRGTSVQDMHCDIMKAKGSVNRSNMSSRKFTQMGTATILGEDGFLYSVQCFRQGPTTEGEMRRQ